MHDHIKYYTHTHIHNYMLILYLSLGILVEIIKAFVITSMRGGHNCLKVYPMKIQFSYPFIHIFQLSPRETL